MITFIAVFRFGLSGKRMMMALRRVSSNGQGSAAYDSQVKLREARDEKGDLFAVFTFLMAHSIRRKADNHSLQQGNF